MAIFIKGSSLTTFVVRVPLLFKNRCFVLTHFVSGSIAFSKPMLCIFWGAILKMAGYMTGGVRRVGGNARGIPRTPTKMEKIN